MEQRLYDETKYVLKALNLLEDRSDE